MAALAGWVATARGAADEQALGPMLAALEPRGTAGLVGYFERGRNRQAVLGAALHEPAAQIALALDGSIANAGELRAQLAARGFRFGGESAEEVLLRAYQYWDKDLLKQLRGAFAFALWDGRKDRLLLARDRFGEKPLYLHEKSDALYFASEAKALFKAGIAAKADAAAVRACVAGRYVAGPGTLFAGIRKLQPGCYVVWQHGKLHEARYWSPPDRAPYAQKANPRPLEGFVAALEEALALRPAQGILLSGGLDSAVLLALAAARGGRPQTFALGIEGDKASELPAAAQAARHFGAEHHEIVVAPDELVAHLEYMIARRDAPLPRASDLALCRLASEAGRLVSSVLTGDGCDEVLGGYRRYTLAGRLVAAKESDADPAASAVRRAMYADQTRSLPEELLERNDRGAAPLEVRMPFLDHRLAEYVSALPDAQRVHGLTTKRILREAAERVLPEALRRRRKGSWRLDVAGWLRGGLREFTLDHLRGASCAARQYCDAAALDAMLDEHMNARKNHARALWTLLNIEIWHRAYTPG
jgi:asparagine synthase (glutamine-hydrolysing)